MSIKHIKNKKFKANKKCSLSFIFAFVILIFLLIINFSDIFSSVITNKNSLFFTQKIEVPSYSVYAVSISDFKNFEDAENCANQVKQQGGAGVVYESGEKFVFVSAYPTLIEAKEIQQNLINLGYNSRIVNIKIDAILKEYKGNNCESFVSAINFFRSSFLKVYETAIKFDKEEINKAQVNTVLAGVISQVGTIQKKINKLKQAEDLALKQLIFVPLEEVKNVLKNALYYATEDLNFSSKLKEIYIDLAIKNKDLVNKINSLD